MKDEKEKALDGLAKLQQEWETQRNLHEAAVDDWWDNLHEDEREYAFFSVCKRIHEAELQHGGTYRHALYDVFGFDGGMYLHGMNCGFMAIHNAIGDGEDYQAMRGINRLEVIDENGRALVKYLDKDEKVRYYLQDDNRTLKVFIEKVSLPEDW
jgi:hypothetical protein